MACPIRQAIDFCHLALTKPLAGIVSIGNGATSPQDFEGMSTGHWKALGRVNFGSKFLCRDDITPKAAPTSTSNHQRHFDMTPTPSIAVSTAAGPHRDMRGRYSHCTNTPPLPSNGKTSQRLPDPGLRCLLQGDHWEIVQLETMTRGGGMQEHATQLGGPGPPRGWASSSVRRVEEARPCGGTRPQHEWVIMTSEKGSKACKGPQHVRVVAVLDRSLDRRFQYEGCRTSQAIGNPVPWDGSKVVLYHGIGKGILPGRKIRWPAQDDYVHRGSQTAAQRGLYQCEATTTHFDVGSPVAWQGLTTTTSKKDRHDAGLPNSNSRYAVQYHSEMTTLEKVPDHGMEGGGFISMARIQDLRLQMIVYHNVSM
ncbi:hypothetical protein EDD18DRAFT_1430134 [Armillaria luteobubalina]|uniref:Uncharacterized protein n=1 Tax=Armillaria luteobubalina TaxID=153913 RepID=A0AA39UEN2_9AGAR|nr:hypothetical protein EDD18DRAFT_1430134 [Armillaria luteobubalina]